MLLALVRIRRRLLAHDGEGLLRAALGLAEGVEVDGVFLDLRLDRASVSANDQRVGFLVRRGRLLSIQVLRLDGLQLRS